MEALRMHGKDNKKIQAHIATKTIDQVRSHKQKFVNDLKKHPDREGQDLLPLLEAPTIRYNSRNTSSDTSLS